MKTTEIYSFFSYSTLKQFLDDLEQNRSIVGYSIDPRTGVREVIVETIKEIWGHVEWS